MVTKLLHKSVSSPWSLNLHSLLIQTMFFLQAAYWKSVGTLGLKGLLPHGNSADSGYTLIKREEEETLLARRLVFLDNCIPRLEFLDNPVKEKKGKTQSTLLILSI